MASLPYPHPTNAHVSDRMRRNPRRDTRPEMALRRVLHNTGLRYRIDYAIRTPQRLVRPDVVFTRARLAIFVDGCFWHCCPEHGRHPARNTWYWTPKLQANVDRDRRADSTLRAAGWTVIRIWEHEPVESATERVLLELRRERNIEHVFDIIRKPPIAERG